MRTSTLAAWIILGVSLALMVASARGDSAIVDELAHIPAGFGYVTRGDYRLNPEHPPLIKVLAALSADMAVRPHFPTDTQSWQNDVNGQWTQGGIFLYGSGNDADRIIFWSRLPLMILAVVFGWILFAWTRREFGGTAALLTLAFFAFSPTLLAHARFVTTDVGAAFGFFIGITGFIAFLRRPTWRTILIAGILCGIAELLKFSLVLLVPMYAALIAGWVWAMPHTETRERLRVALRVTAQTLLIGAVGILVIWMAYFPLVRHYPPERQARDAEFLLGSYGFRPAVNLDLALIRNPVTRPLGQYVLGVLMVQQRSAGGNTNFFLGKVSGIGSHWYFPLMYLLKEPLALHILTLIALMAGAARIRVGAGGEPPARRIRRWIAGHFAEFACLVVIAVYWAISVKSPLNIGVRHVLPTFPFIYILVSVSVARWLAPDLHGTQARTSRNLPEILGIVWRRYIAVIPRYAVVGVLVIWLVAGTVIAYPRFLSYYNELAGGSSNGWRIAVDSNYDWGQDLKRLTQYANDNHIPKISLDYFGGADPRYYLGDRFEPWWSSRGPAHGWFAISASFRQGAFGTPAPGFTRKPENSYLWLRPYAPVARVGDSIFVYNLP
jgi:4-amino-4-deoxy-L-arabinose transferase-like glycosyltransferase